MESVCLDHRATAAQSLRSLAAEPCSEAVRFAEEMLPRHGKRNSSCAETRPESGSKSTRASRIVSAESRQESLGGQTKGESPKSSWRCWTSLHGFTARRSLLSTINASCSCCGQATLPAKLQKHKIVLCYLQQDSSFTLTAGTTAVSAWRDKPESIICHDKIDWHEPLLYMAFLSEPMLDCS